jgi:hypothetical protein
MLFKLTQGYCLKICVEEKTEEDVLGKQKTDVIARKQYVDEAR